MVPAHHTSTRELPGQIPGMVTQLLTHCRTHRAKGGTIILASRVFSWFEGDSQYEGEVVLQGYQQSDGAMPTLTAAFRVRHEDGCKNELESRPFTPTSDVIETLPGATGFRHDSDGWTRVELPFSG